jgi:protein-L-isoaspartate O-methyltransferase
MERAKGEYHWRAFSAERALEELERLQRFTDLGHWVVNVADPLFGFQRAWRRQLVEGVIRRGIQPRQFWTLTRPDDLERQDVQLLARGRFSIGIGLESASPDMLRLMNKARKPGPYLEAVSRLARLSRQEGLSWAANIIVGHPGETLASLGETHSFLEQLFLSAPQTNGWLSVDPFRLYPGSHVHQNMEAYEQQHGTRFFFSDWYRGWYNAGFFAEHLDPGSELDYPSRVRESYRLFAPLVREIKARFSGQGREIDQVFARSQDEQVRLMSDDMRDRLLQQDRRHRQAEQPDSPEVLAFPIGLQIRDPAVRQRESAVRRLLERGVLRSDALIEALLVVPPGRYLSEQEQQALFSDAAAEVREGAAPAWLGISTCALALEALQPGPGDRVADLLALRGYISAILARLVGETGQVVAVVPGSRRVVGRLRSVLDDLPQVQPVQGIPTTVQGLSGAFQCLWLGAALPRLPRELVALVDPQGGRVATLLGPRFSSQDLVCVSRRAEALTEQILCRVRAPVVAGPNGWLQRSRRSRS